MAKRIGFLFAGQGAQAVGMGRDLADAVPAAADVFHQADRVLGWSVSRLCLEGPLESLTESRHCQPAIYTMSLACLGAWRQRLPGLEPVVCGGLSLGEFAALTAAGALDMAHGLKLVAARGQFMQEACRASAGAMAAVLNADPALVARTAAAAGVDVANENCPGQIVISGGRTEVTQAVEALKAAGVSKVVMLQVDGAFHSRLMKPAADRFGPLVAGVPLSPPRCPVVQNVVGALVTDPAEIRRHLAAQVTGTVHWESCVRAMLGCGVEAMVELGPGKVLRGFMRRIDPAVPTFAVGTLPELEKAVAALA